MKPWQVSALLVLAAVATVIVQLSHLSQLGLVSSPGRVQGESGIAQRGVPRLLAPAERPQTASFAAVFPPFTAPASLQAVQPAASPAGEPSLQNLPIMKIGYVKTHKTASTTLGAVLFRFGARNGKRFYCQGKADKPCRAAHIIWANRSIPLQEEGLFDLQLNHFSGNGMWKGQFQGHVVDWYRRMLGGTAGGEGRPNWALVGMVREPVSRYLSWFYYFSEPDTKMPVAEYARRGLGANGLAREFGVKTEAEAAAFASEIAWGLKDPQGGSWGAVQLWLPMERFDDALLLMRRTLGWSMLDLTYVKMFDSHRANATRWDGKHIKPTPKPKDLPPGTVDRIRQITRLDSIIYDAAIAAFEGELSRAQATPEQAAEWEREKGEFERMQRALRDTLGVGGPCAAALKHWYALDDLGYEGKVEPDGFVRLHPALGYEAMRRAWEGSGGARFCG